MPKTCTFIGFGADQRVAGRFCATTAIPPQKPCQYVTNNQHAVSRLELCLSDWRCFSRADLTMASSCGHAARRIQGAKRWRAFVQVRAGSGMAALKLHTLLSQFANSWKGASSVLGNMYFKTQVSVSRSAAARPC